MKFKVEYTITGCYEVDAKDLDIEGAEQRDLQEVIEEAAEVIGDDPYTGVDLDKTKITNVVTVVKPEDKKADDKKE